MLFPDSKVAISAILDGTSNTIIFGERHVSESRNYGWWYAGWGQTQSGSLDSLMGSRELNYDRRLDNCPIGPYNFTVGKSKNPCDVFHYWSHHSGGAAFAFADGSVKFLRYEQDIILKALATRAGREDVSID
ncbi:DUF1559 domain-containing protein [Telmatocola sphagniphila]|uniref:DUF1559 domain-containing protein n=1 Tax=Telmatocola sphagniphila TaxID=1123043 RepID=A0A8E6B9Z6_9BACT|nr:DUF1559 domain-containing protein [Telmatocola sphagniphila]